MAVRRTRKRARPRRPKTVAEALRSRDPLPALHAIVGDANRAGAALHWGYACVLETSSGGLSILLDRFAEDELDRIEQALKTIGATATLADLRAARKAFAKGAESEISRFDRRHDAHVQEMEEKLLAFCRAHPDDLAAAGPPEAPESVEFYEQAAQKVIDAMMGAAAPRRPRPRPIRRGRPKR